MDVVDLRSRDLEVLRTTLGRYGFVREARIFGSRAVGTARRASDVDLAISAPTAGPREWADLCEALENAPLIYELDVVRTDRTLNERLRERIDRDGVTIFSAPA